MASSLLSTLTSGITKALKAGQTVRVETLRFLVSAVRNAAIDKYRAAGEASLTDADVLAVVKKQVKTHRESIEAFEKAGRTDLTDREKAQLAILEAMLPKELSDDELKTTLAPIVATGEKNFGALMKQAMAVLAGKAEGGRVAGILKQILELRTL